MTCGISHAALDMSYELFWFKILQKFSREEEDFDLFLTLSYHISSDVLKDTHKDTKPLKILLCQQGLHLFDQKYN